MLILRHAWLNPWGKHMTTGRINQVSLKIPSWTLIFLFPQLRWMPRNKTKERMKKKIIKELHCVLNGHTTSSVIRPYRPSCHYYWKIRNSTSKRIWKRLNLVSRKKQQGYSSRYVFTLRKTPAKCRQHRFPSIMHELRLISTGPFCVHKTNTNR